jgi:hypothetical protein
MQECSKNDALCQPTTQLEQKMRESFLCANPIFIEFLEMIVATFIFITQTEK